MNFTKKFSWTAIFSAALVLFCFEAASSAAEEKYILENREVHRVTADGTRRRIDDVRVETGAEGTVL